MIPDTAEAMRAECHRILARLWYMVGVDAQRALVRAQSELEKVEVETDEAYGAD